MGQYRQYGLDGKKRIPVLIRYHFTREEMNELRNLGNYRQILYRYGFEGLPPEIKVCDKK